MADHYTQAERAFWAAVDSGEVELRQAPNCFNHDFLDKQFWRADVYYMVRFPGRPYEARTEIGSAPCVMDEARRFWFPAVYYRAESGGNR